MNPKGKLSQLPSLLAVVFVISFAAACVSTAYHQIVKEKNLENTFKYKIEINNSPQNPYFTDSYVYTNNTLTFTDGINTNNNHMIFINEPFVVREQ